MKAADTELLWAERVMQPSSRLSLIFSQDEDQNLSGVIDIDYATQKNNHWYSNLSSANVALTEGNDRVASALIGFMSDPLEDWYYTLEAEYWGVPNHLVMGGISGGVGYNYGGWSFLVISSLRRYRAYYSNLPIGRFYDVGSNKLGLNLSYFFEKGFWVRSSHYVFSYDQVVSVIDDQSSQSQFSETTQSLSASLADQITSLEFGYSKKKLHLSVAGVLQVSAVDQTDSTGYTVKLGWDWTDSWSSSFGYGNSQSSESDSDVNYVDFEITYFWQ